MWLLTIVVIIIAALFGRVHFRFAPPPNVNTLVKIRSGSIHVTRGALTSLTKEHIAGIVNETGIVHGFIAITPSQRVVFSRHIPPLVQQQIRNVLVNQ
ncbi:MAG: hypothetical protein O3A29_10990 [Planctomycetota bacterium]|nr:hypothetical protein [Planctomycetota bacterium]